jgi:hypothetical protein
MLKAALSKLKKKESRSTGESMIRIKGKLLPSSKD